jgi:hypothetical protein
MRFRRTSEDVTAWENMEEGIEIVWVRAIEPVKVDLRVATRDARENLKRRIRRSVRTCLTTHHNDASVGQNQCRRVPAATLYKNRTLRTQK